MNTISIKVFQRQSEDWNVFFEFPFDSTRKRMSLIVKSQNSEDYLLLTKGADSIMIPRLLIDKAELKILEKQLSDYAREGLRTLVMAQRKISK